jgi:hypothetical protein
VRPEPSQSFDGISLLGVLSGKEPVRERTQFWRINRADRIQKAARKGKWKWIREGEFDQLYDLAADPGERKDVAYRHPEVTREMARLYGEWEMIFKNNPPPKVIA